LVEQNVPVEEKKSEPVVEKAQPPAEEKAAKKPSALKSVVMKTRVSVLEMYLKPLQSLTDEAVLEFSKQGVSSSVVDPAHVAMATATLSSDSPGVFDSLKVEGTVEVGIDLAKVKEFLNCVKSDAEVEVWTQGLDLMFRSGNLTRRMRATETESFSRPKMPNVKLPGMASVLPEELIRAIKAAEVLSDHISIEIQPGALRLKAAGETDSMTMDLSKDVDDVSVEVEGGATVRSLFPLDYFAHMVKSATSRVTLRIGNDYLVKAEWNPSITVGDKTVVIGRVLYLVAPRIESE
jgi:proliferating cell nuclear antigen